MYCDVPRLQRSLLHSWGMWWCRWLRHCATSRNVAGSFHDGVTGIFHWHDLSGGPIALGSTQPLMEMSTRNISWGVKATGAEGWQTYYIYMPIVLKSAILNLLEPSSAVQGLLYLYLHLLLPSSSICADGGGSRYHTTTSYNRHNHRCANLKYRKIVTEFWFVLILS